MDNKEKLNLNISNCCSFPSLINSPKGPTGPTGSTGPTGAGGIIPFASGDPITTTTVLGGVLNTASVIGFGSSAIGIPAGSGSIDLTGGSGISLDYAFSMPREGNITSLSAYFSTTLPLNLVGGSTVTITAQLFSSTTPDNNFTAIPGAVVTLAPALTGLVSVGAIAEGITTGLAIPVTARTRILLVFVANVTAGPDIATIVQGYASGGLAIN